LQKTRFGIIGCSKIANRSTIPAILNSDCAKLEMIGSRSLEIAKTFAKTFGCKKFGSYADILNDNNIDAVYISLPIALHEEWAIKAAKAGKHVLCEKSSTVSFESAKRMVDAAKQNNVRLMEGFMFRFHPQHKKVLELIQNNVIGKLFAFDGMYGFPPVPKNDIRYNAELGGGVLNETGCYPIYASRMIFGEEPISVICNLYNDETTNVDTKGHAYLLYNNKKVAFVSFGFENYYQANYKIWGSDGIIELDRAYAVPTNLSTTVHVKTEDAPKEITIDAIDHFTQMIDSFCNELKNKANSSFENDLLNQALVMESLRKSNREKRPIHLPEISTIKM